MEISEMDIRPEAELAALAPTWIKGNLDWHNDVPTIPMNATLDRLLAADIERERGASDANATEKHS